ncbi:hypothetical protein CW701_00830 [Candidatus Bathyarchaeota archaeon]|nr:MAG: hypothetical protein CW701_00830 [Candidatus Bathyarchaeota archaeon]RLI19588.1 MAG: hypothetical protein DRO49_00150 [Candidatus Bathyarchaeota archaeon]
MERGDLQEGFKLIRQRRLEEAREFFQELLRLNPGDVGALFALGCVYAALVEEKAKFRGVKYLGGILIALTIILGFLIEAPILRHSICNNKHFEPMDVIEVEEGDWQHRLAADAFEVTIWFATYHRVPLMKGYYSYLTPYLTWCDWSSQAIYRLRGNIDET